MKNNAKKLKDYWGLFPFTIYLVLQIIILCVNNFSELQLRSAPTMFLYWFATVSILFVFLWVAISLYKGIRLKRIRGYNILDKIVLIIFSLVSVGIVFLAVLISSFLNTEEQVVIKNNIKMVAAYNNFSEDKVNYYEYKNKLFYGKNLGFEIYINSQLNSPFDDEFKETPISWIFYDLDGNVIDSSNKADRSKNEFKKINIEVIENRKDELVFNFSLDDFINNYNKYYFDNKGVKYLKHSSSWQLEVMETAVHSKYKMNNYRFKEDDKNWLMPILSVYVPENSDFVEEIIINFDDHGHTEEMYNIYEEICFYTLKVFFPDLSDDKIIELCRDVNESAYQNVFSKEKDYKEGIVPSVLYLKGNVGVYPYYAVGDYVRFCIIPVDDETVKDFKNKGVIIKEIK